jgi:hypothetical protein
MLSISRETILIDGKDQPETLVLREQDYLYAVSILGWKQAADGTPELNHRAIFLTAPTDDGARAIAMEHAATFLPGYDDYDVTVAGIKIPGNG